MLANRAKRDIPNLGGNGHTVYRRVSPAELAFSNAGIAIRTE